MTSDAFIMYDRRRIKENENKTEENETAPPRDFEHCSENARSARTQFKLSTTCYVHMTVTRSKSGMRNPREKLKPTATSITPKKRSRKEKTDDKTTTPTLDFNHTMTEIQPESSPNENLVDDTPPSPELLEKN